MNDEKIINDVLHYIETNKIKIDSKDWVISFYINKDYYVATCENELIVCFKNGRIIEIKEFPCVLPEIKKSEIKNKNCFNESIINNKNNSIPKDWKKRLRKGK